MPAAFSHLTTGAGCTMRRMPSLLKPLEEPPWELPKVEPPAKKRLDGSKDA